MFALHDTQTEYQSMGDEAKKRGWKHMQPWGVALRAWKNAKPGRTYKQLAEYLDEVDISVVSRWTRGMPISDKHKPRVAEFLGITIDELLTGNKPSLPVQSVAGCESDAKRIPIVGTAWAGAAGHADDSVRVPTDWAMDGTHTESEVTGDTILISAAMYEEAMRDPRHRVYGVVVEGDSMDPEYKPKDIILVERINSKRDLRPHDHVVVHLGNGDGCVLKEFGAKPVPHLISLNRAHGILFLSEYPEHRFEGRVCGMYRSKK